MDELQQGLFAPLDRAEKAGLKTETETIAFWSDVWRRFRHNVPGMTGVVIIVVFIVMALVGPLMTPYSYEKVDLNQTYMAPGAAHWFGTDALGRDIWARIWIGARVSLFIGVVSALSQMVIGVIIGAISGIYGGVVDMVIMRAVDILIAVPFLIWVSLFMLVLRPA
jgi:oligopeptide transport system permease protein